MDVCCGTLYLPWGNFGIWESSGRFGFVSSPYGTCISVRVLGTSERYAFLVASFCSAGILVVIAVREPC